MAINAGNVLVGSPDQKTTGAILDAPLGTPLPKAATETPDAKFEDSGFISEDGVVLTVDVSTDTIKDWSASTVRKVLSDFNGTIKWTELEMSKKALERAFGKDAVKTKAADQTHGTRTEVAIGAVLPEARSWVFKIKDGKKRVLIVVPNGQASLADDISFVSSEAATVSIELACSPDANGKNIYIYTDDGVAAA